MYCFQCRLYVTRRCIFDSNTVFMYFFLKERFVRDTKQLIGNSYITAVKRGRDSLTSVDLIGQHESSIFLCLKTNTHTLTKSHKTQIFISWSLYDYIGETLFVVALSRVYVTSGKFIPKHLIDHFNIISALIDALLCVQGETHLSTSASIVHTVLHAVIFAQYLVILLGHFTNYKKHTIKSRSFANNDFR